MPFFAKLKLAFKVYVDVIYGWPHNHNTNYFHTFLCMIRAKGILMIRFLTEKLKLLSYEKDVWK